MIATARNTELLDVLDQADREVRAFIEGLSESDLVKKTSESNWNVGQLAGHVAQVPWALYVVRRLSQNKNAAAPAPLGFILNLGNWWTSRRFKSTSKQQLLDAWTKGFDEYRAFVSSLPEEALAGSGEVSGRGRMTVADFVRTAPDHLREHAETIRHAVQAG